MPHRSPSSRPRAARRSDPRGAARWLGGLLLALGACTAPRQEPVGKPLPFHVAVVPLAVEDVEQVDPIAGAATEGDSDETVGLALDPVTVSREVVRILDGSVFTLASLLEPPADGPGVDDTYWVQAAEQAGADLLLYCERLQYVPEASTRRINFLSSSLPLFLIGGPFVYFINDRDYTVDAQLFAKLFDLNRVGWNPPPAGERLVLGRHVQHSTFDVRPDPVRLNFTQRVEAGDLGAWGASIVIPTGFLERDNSTVRAAVTSAASASLGRNLAQQLRGRAREILQPDEERASFYLDLDTFRADVLADGRVDVEAGLLLRRTKNTTGIGRATLFVGDEAVDCEYRPVGAATEGALQRYALQAVAPLPAPTDVATRGEPARPAVMRLEVVDRGTVTSTRTWTFPLPVPGPVQSPVQTNGVRQGP